MKKTYRVVFIIVNPKIECEHPFKRLHWVRDLVFCNKCGKTLNKKKDE